MTDLILSENPELAALARARKYEFFYHPDFGVWLKWSDKCGRIGSYSWASLFKPFQLFEERPGEEPSLSLYTLTDYLKEDLAHQQAVYDETLQALDNPEAFVSLEKIPLLATMRDAVERQMEKLDRKMQSYFPDVQHALKVWVAETERVLLQEGRASEVIARVIARENERCSHNFNAMVRRGVEEDKAKRFTQRAREAAILKAKEWRGAALFYRDTRFLWDFMTKGIKQDGLDRLLNRFTSTYFVPEPVARSTRNGLLRYHSDIHPLHRKLAHLNNKRIIYEEFLNALLLDEIIPDWKAITERTKNQHGDDRGRPYFFPFEDSQRWYDELSVQPEYQGRGGKTKIINEMVDLHEEATGVRPHFDTIRDHVRKIEKGG